jgi:hypothetical protein
LKEKGRAAREFEKRRVCLRARVYATTNSSRRSLSLFDDDDAKKGVHLIRERREKKEGLGITILKRLMVFCVSTQHKKSRYVAS